MVRNAITVAGVTSSCKTEYTPTLISTSWTMAAIALSAIRHSNRQAMNSATRMMNTTSARIADLVISLPHDEVTELLLTSAIGTLAAAPSASMTFLLTSGVCSPTWIRSRSTPLADTVTIFASTAFTPFALRMSRACFWEMFAAGTSHCTPPLKSSPRFRPCATSETRVMTMSAADTPRPHHLRPMKSIEVSPW